jgi:hypothetical protein
LSSLPGPSNGGRLRSERTSILGAAVVAVLLSIAMNWQLVKHIRTDVAGDVTGYDSLVISWNIAWGGYAVFQQPLSYLDSNAHFPSRNALAFMDALVGYAVPVGWIGTSPESALFLHNLVHLFAFALAFFGAWLLSRELGMGAVASAVAGVAYAYAPWRADQIGHLHVLSSGGIALALAFLVRGYRHQDWRFVLAGWLVATWQVMLGFTLGLMLGYLLAALAVIGMVWWLRRGRPQPGRHVARATIFGGIVFVGWGVLQSIPFLEVVAEHPEAIRGDEEVLYFSPSPSGIVTAPEANVLWGPATAKLRAGRTAPNEQSIFPGALALALGMTGLFCPMLAGRVRVLLLAITATTLMLSFGLSGPGASLYQSMLDYAPGWRGIRTPGRLTTLTTLALGVLAASAVQMLMNDSKPGKRARSALGLVLVIAMLLEGAYGLKHMRPPEKPAALASLPGPQMHLPSDPHHDAIYMYWSIGDFTKIANGHGAFIPRELVQLREAVAAFPDAKSLAALRQSGVRTVVFHRNFVSNSVAQGVDSQSIDGLGIRKRKVGDIVIFELDR